MRLAAPAADFVDLESDRHMRVLALSEGLALVETQNRGTIDNPDICFSIVNLSASSAPYYVS